MQNIGNPYQYINNFYTPSLQDVQASDLVPVNTPTNATTPTPLPNTETLERIKAYQQSLVQPNTPQAGIDTGEYSQYGVNYDINGDGRVTPLEGMSLGGLWNNIVSNTKEIGTGLTYLGTHPKEALGMLGQYGADLYYRSDGNPLKQVGNVVTDITDAILSPYALESEARNRNLGNVLGSAMAGDWSGAGAYAQQGLSEMTHRMYEQPLYVGLDAVTPFAGKAIEGVTKGGKAATKAQNVISTTNAKISQDVNKMVDAGNKLVKNTEKIPPARLVEAAETGNWEGIPNNLKAATKEYSDIVDNTMAKHSPATHIEAEELSIIQKYARDNNITYQAAERIVNPYLDIIKQAKAGEIPITQRYVPNTGLADDIKSIVKVEELPKTQPKPESILKYDTPLLNQSPEVQQALRKVLTVDELYSLKNSTGVETFDYIKKSRNLTDRQMSDLLSKNGIGGIDGKFNRAFNAKSLGKIDKKTKNITLDPQADAATAVHEWAHRELLDAIDLAKTNDANALKELTELRRALNLDDTVIITDKILEDVSDAVSNFYRTGKLPEGALGEYIGKRYGILKKTSKNINESLLKRLDDLAVEGDSIAQQVATNKRLFDKGDIFPITHGLAEVDKTAGLVDDLGRMFAGRFSKRAFGNASYEAIAKEIANPNDYINQLTKNYLDENIKNVIRNGGTADIDIRPVNPESAMYVSRAALEDGNKSLAQVLESASKSPVSPDDIPIDKDFLKTFKDQYIFQQTANPFGRTVMGDLYNLRKSTALASGGYLVGNLQTGVANAIMNSNVGLVDDLINATLTKGKLAKELGLFRRDGIRNTNITKFGKAAQEVNLRTGGYLLSKADSKMQNLFAEIAAHSKLRRQGVTPSQRASAIQAMEGQKLGEFINDVKLVSLINPTKTILPAGLHGVGGIFNPFWKWVDTAAQSSLYMVKNHPVLANAVLFDVMSRVGYDKELQNRLGIGVELSKPFVSYKVNPKTGEPREMSMEYLPQMNTLKFSAEVADAIKGKGDLDSLTQASIPLIGSILMAAKGLNKYGKPMYRDHDSMYDSISVIGGKRYRLNSQTGLPEPLTGQADEIVTAFANETLGSLSLINRTLAPTAAWATSKLTGRDYEYYLPYGQTLFGSFGERGINPTERIPFLISGDPTRPRSGQEIGNMLQGIYEQGYYPTPKLEQGIYNPTILRNFYKGLNRRDMREMQMLQNR